MTNWRASNRRGYALLLVMLFVVLFGAMLGVAWRRVASAIRTEHVCDVRKRCDRGSIPVLAQAMQVLETRLRWSAADNAAELDVSNNSTPNYLAAMSTFSCKAGPAYQLSDDPNDTRWYRVVFTPTATDGTAWSVSVTVADPTENFSTSSLPVLPGSPP
jgi:hypothetical protein